MNILEMQLQFVNKNSFFFSVFILLSDVNVTVSSFHKSNQGSQAASLCSPISLQLMLPDEDHAK